MKSAAKSRLVLVTAPSRRVARALAKAALNARLVACVNLLPTIESHYWWQDSLERGNEVLMILKTTAPLVIRLEQLIVDLHPYDTPEFLVLRIDRGNQRYLRWLSDSCTERVRSKG